MDSSSSSLRRRGQLVPLDSEETITDFSTFDDPEGVSLEPPSEAEFDHYVSPCEFRVSNDPLVVSDHDVCDATIYGCVRDHLFLISSDEDIKEMDLRYDYDLYYKGNSRVHDVTDLVEFLEGTMLEHLASVLEIKQCPPGSSGAVSTRGGGTRLLRSKGLLEEIQKGRNLMEFTEEQKSVFVAINSAPEDVALKDYECVTQPEQGVRCQPMVGFMKLYLEAARVTEEEAIAVSEAVMMVLQGGMDENVYTKGAIKNVVYVTERKAPEIQPPPVPPPPAVLPPTVISSATQGEPPSASPRNGNGLGMSDMAIGVIVGASSVVLLLAVLALFLLARRQKVESTTTTHNAVPKEKLRDDPPSVQSSPKRSPLRRNSGKKIAPTIGEKRSLEGAEIPGSLAAMDALALKPQIQRAEADENNSFSIEDQGAVAPLTPPRLARKANSSRSPLAEAEDGSIEASLPPTMPTFTLLPVPLSPVRNKRSGVSPSRVSPKRLPHPLNEPYVSKSPRRNNTRTVTPSPPRKSKSKSKNKAPAVEVQHEQSGIGTKGSGTTLGKILDSSASSSLQDTVSTSTNKGKFLPRGIKKSKR